MTKVQNNGEVKRYGTGALKVIDERDNDYPVGEVLKERDIDYLQKRKNWFSNGWWGDQKESPQCVGYAWSHWLDAGPDRKSFFNITEKLFSGGQPIDPQRVYKGAQGLDAFPGKGYKGTSVRAGAKYIQDLGFIDEYRWTDDIDEVVSTLLSVGPLVTRVNWFEKMYQPNERGIIEVDLSDEIVYGHAFLLVGVDLEKSLIKFKNSWGRSWGFNGYGFLQIEDLEDLLHLDVWSQCCLPI